MDREIVLFATYIAKISRCHPTELLLNDFLTPIIIQTFSDPSAEHKAGSEKERVMQRELSRWQHILKLPLAWILARLCVIIRFNKQIRLDHEVYIYLD